MQVIIDASFRDTADIETIIHKLYRVTDDPLLCYVMQHLVGLRALSFLIKYNVVVCAH